MIEQKQREIYLDGNGFDTVERDLFCNRPEPDALGET